MDLAQADDPNPFVICNLPDVGRVETVKEWARDVVANRYPDTPQLDRKIDKSASPGLGTVMWFNAGFMFRPAGLPTSDSVTQADVGRGGLGQDPAAKFTSLLTLFKLGK
jgi:hypothetical protein